MILRVLAILCVFVSPLHAAPPTAFGPEHPILRWRLETGGPVRSGPAAGPDGIIVFGSDDGRLRAVSPDGTIRWVLDLGAPIRSAPAVSSDGTVFVGAENRRLHAVAPEGRIRWTAEFDAPVRCRPAAAADGGAIVTAGSVLAAVDADGAFRWRRDTGLDVLSDPVVLPDGRIAAGGADGYLLIHGADGAPEIVRQAGLRFVSTPAVGPDGDLYLGAGGNELISTNSEVIRNWVVGSGNHRVGPPAVGPEGIVAAGSDNGYFFAVTPEGRKEWAIRTGDWITTRPAVDAAGRVYAGSWDGSLYAAGPDGAVLWRFGTGGAIEADPLLAPDGTLLVPSADGVLYALGGPADRPVLVLETRNRADGAPVAGVAISLISETGAGHDGVTGPAGTAAFSLDSGAWRLRAEAEGFAPAAAEISVSAEGDRRTLHLVPLGPLRLPPAPLPRGTADAPYAARLPISGGTAPYTFSVADGALPEGIALDSSEGTLAGTPTEAGVFEPTISARDAEDRTARRVFTLDVAGTLRLASDEPLPEAMVGEPYEVVLKAAGGLPPIRYSPAGTDALPAGLALSPDGRISGVPETPGEATAALKIRSREQEAEATVPLPAAERLRVTTEFLPDAVVGRPYRAAIETAGGTGERAIRFSGTPPAGLGFGAGTIEGTPARAGTGTVEVRVTDAAGREAAKRFPLTAADPLALTADRMPKARIGEEYRETLPITGGIPPYAVEILDPLPAGLALGPETGEIAGTPTEAAWTNARVAIRDAAAPEQRTTGVLAVRVDPGP